MPGKPSRKGGVVIGVDIVKPHYRLPLLKQAPTEVKADETGRSCDKNSHQFPATKNDKSCKTSNNVRQLMFKIFRQLQSNFFSKYLTKFASLFVLARIAC